jgi:hypothetical protein
MKNEKVTFYHSYRYFVFATPAMALYTECTVTRDMDLATRPNGPSEPRYRRIEKGDKIAYRQSYQGWWFVMHAKDDSVDYGWVPQNVLSNCTAREGTRRLN